MRNICGKQVLDIVMHFACALCFESSLPIPVELFQVDGSFKLKCTFGSRGGWSTSITACVTPKGTEVGVGSDLTDDGVEYTCRKGNSEGSVNFSWKAV
ncbi:hypothetical protein TELCIR_01708 [Teladorsagia circumcincta]|uniref:Abnormal cell migration protein 18-like fibronectin type I domain-containing protein n=1 Tax=Teladorsagia circumcincta TaxID=45464 RepID=A0A2G9V157_TELCI|nr:hypothetical protein TELCIR_01708 [Teladorsagia circumcincta]